MLQIINMFLVVVIFWLIIEFITVRVNKNRKMVNAIDQFHNKSE